MTRARRLAVWTAVLPLALLAACGDEPAPPTAAPAAPTPPAGLPEIMKVWNWNDPAASERAFRDLLPKARASGDVAYLAELLTQVGRAQGLQLQFDAADRTLDEAQALLGPATARARVLVLLERGRVRTSSKRKDEARPHFREALAAAQDARLDGLAVDAAHMLAIAETGPAVLEWNLKALDLAERSSDPKARAWLGSLYNNIGWTYHGEGRFDLALPMFEKALAYHQQQKSGDGTRIAHWCVARCLRSLGRVGEALAIQQTLEAEWERLGKPDGYVFEELGECLWTLGRKDDARPHFAQAHAILSKDPWLQRDEAPRLARLARLASGAAE
jgi:tetratricopeptide (TPR) repeat protein